MSRKKRKPYTIDDFHSDLLKHYKDYSASEAKCPHYRYYRPDDGNACPYSSEPQMMFWYGERDFHQSYGRYGGCSSTDYLWAYWNDHRDWYGPELMQAQPLADRLLAFYLLDRFKKYYPDDDFPLDEYFSLDDRGGRPCQECTDGSRRTCPSPLDKGL